MTKSMFRPSGKITPIRTHIKDKTKEEMASYLSYAGFDDEGDFIDQCINFAIEKDKNYQSFKKSKQKEVEKSARVS